MLLCGSWGILVTNSLSQFTALLNCTHPTIFNVPLKYYAHVVFSLEQFKGAHKTGSKTWRFRCLLEKFEGTHGAFTQHLAGYADDPYAFCDEVEHSTSGVVQHEKKESSPELFPSPKPTVQEKGSTSTQRSRKRKDPPAESGEPVQEKGSTSTQRSRKRKDPPAESGEPGPSKRMKEVADIEAELQAQYIGTTAALTSLIHPLCASC